MTIVITGATGHLGRLAIDGLISRGVAADTIVAAGRNEAKLAELAPLGVSTAVIDFTQPDTLDAAFAGAELLLLVSGSEIGSRVDQHRNAVEAAVKAGVSRIVYTSAPHADDTALILAPEHKATEEIIRASGLPFTILRNGWYTENYASLVPQAHASGVVVSSTGTGRVSSASRRDYADAAAVVLTTNGHENAIYELGGDTAWDWNELAVVLSEITGREVTASIVSADEHADILRGAGLDEGTIGFLVGLDENICDGLLGETSGDLARLIGRPTTPLIDGLRDSQ